jgi:hypothetical protein
MTHTDLLARDALAEAFESLNRAAAELTVAALVAPAGSALACDACLLADVVEAEAAAVLVTLQRRC